MISSRCLYAIRAMLELARRDGAGLVTISEIAAARHIPPRFLESILVQLKQAGLVRSVRGKQGGYLIDRSPERISIGDVVYCIEGPLFSASPSPGRKARRKADPGDILADIWAGAEKAAAGFLNSVTLSQVVEKEARSALVEQYYI